MTDPAEDAAQRVKDAGEPFRPLYPDDLIDAAREALKPIRDLHRPVDTYLWANVYCETNHEVTNDTASGDDVCLTCTASDGGPTKTCQECFDNDGSTIDWPCATARLVYPEGEL